ncbi:MAG: hypothetical protein JXR73_20335, partial [Candidatus Omnitrophica bacterium]|nr:hypothetical protein [Candidatus Omnitrophota bacterium]
SGSLADGVEVQIDVLNDGCSSSGSVNHRATFHENGVFYQDASLVADGVLYNTIDPDFNTYDFTPIDAAAWYQPGIVLPVSSMQNGTAVSEFLQSMRERTAPNLHSYGSAQFESGEGLFAGLNLMPEAMEGNSFQTQIDDETIGFTSSEYTKLYVRHGGASGVVDAESADQTFDIYDDPECAGSDQPGYAITLTSFGQAYLDCLSEGLSSTIDGQITIPWPSSIDIPFEGMVLDECGDFTGGDIPADAREETRTLAYWQADMRLLAFAFDPMESDPDNRTLWISSKNPIADLEDEPIMQINLRPCGTIRESRIDSPLLTVYDGYDMTVQRIYLSKWDGSLIPSGFYNVLGDFALNFFTPPKVHILVRGDIGDIVGGDPWFSTSDADPDADRDGFPDALSLSSGSMVEKIYEYINQTPVQVSYDFAGCIDLDYGLRYNKPDKSFACSEPYEQDLILIDMRSAVEYCGSASTEISFGLDIVGISGLRLTNMGSFLGEMFDGPINESIEEAANRLTGDLSTELRAPIEEAIDAHVVRFMSETQQDLVGLERDQYADYFNGLIAGPETGRFFNARMDILFGSIDFNSVLHNDDNMPAAEYINETIDYLSTATDIIASASEQWGDNAERVQDIIEMLLEFRTNYRVDDERLERILTQMRNVIGEIGRYADAFLTPSLEVARDALKLTDPSSYILFYNEFFKDEDIDAFEDAAKAQLTAFFRTTASSEPSSLAHLSPDEINDFILAMLFNTSMYQKLNQKVVMNLYPVKEQLLNKAAEIVDTAGLFISRAVQEMMSEGESEGESGAIQGAMGFEGASMKGSAIISGGILEKLRIEASLSMYIPDELKFGAYVEYTRYLVSNSGKTCFEDLDEDEIIECKIGVTDIPLNFGTSKLTAKIIEISFMFNREDADDSVSLVNVGGMIETDGKIGFESAEIIDPSFGIAIGKVENYFWAHVGVKLQEYRLEGGIFFGTSCDLEPLRRLDEDVAELLSIEEMRGIFLRVTGDFPLYGQNCLFKIAAYADVAMWYFDNGPTYGGKLVAGAYGQLICIVHIKGQLMLIGGKDAGEYFFRGNAWVGGGIGLCDPSDWKEPQDVLDDDWCFSCVAYFDLVYKNDDWEVDYDADCKF